jgi:hypothetical protein
MRRSLGLADATGTAAGCWPQAKPDEANATIIDFSQFDRTISVVSFPRTRHFPAGTLPL